MTFSGLNRFLFFLGLFFSPMLCVFAQVQDEVNLKLDHGVFLKEHEEASTYYDHYIAFPNLNDVDYYVNAKKLRSIEAAEKGGNFVALDSLLWGYISNFGIRNFMDDVHLLWLAGRTREALYDTVGALLYYELGMNHQRDYRDMMQTRYDSLISPWYSDWVNIEFYYKILDARRKIDPLIPPKGVMLNMGPKVNSDKPDYAPFMHPSDSVLIFTSRRDEDIIIDDIHGMMNEDLFFVEKDWIDGTWSYAEKFSKAINSEFNEGSACLSRDGQVLIFTRCDAEDGMGSCDLMRAEFRGGKWVKVKNLGPKVNSPYWDSQPHLSPDGTALFFTSNREGGFGGSDLYVSYLQMDGSWGKAGNLGPMVNTVDHEVTPFFHKVNETLYFSSTGHLKNAGGYDIFKARWMGRQWESPRSLGPLINSSGNEYYFSIDGKGERLFYAMAKANPAFISELRQDFDLYSFPLPMEARPDAIVTMRGHLIDSLSGHPIRGVVLVIDKETGIEVAPKFINKSGYFEFDLIRDKYYEVYVQGENYLAVREDLDLLTDTSFTTLVRSFELDKPMVFESMRFEENSHELNESIEPKLDYIISFMKRYPMFIVKISGHTDSDGEAKYNLALARKRSNKIKKYIMAKGEIPDSRVIAIGYGETRPLVPNDTEEHKWMNRRVEFELWIDPNYEGDMILPLEDEFDLEAEELFDPEFMREDDFEFEWEEDMDDFDIELEDIDEIEDAEFLIEFDDFGIDDDFNVDLFEEDGEDEE